MKPSTKALKGRTMRVATTFTGAAACAFAFAPMATAGTMAQAHPDNVVSGACGNGTAHWLHLGNGAGGDRCYGDRGGGIRSKKYDTASFCGGNNIGSFTGISAFGDKVTKKFGPGKTYAHMDTTINVSSVVIESFKGSDSCPPP
jgi:hypothetical protein